MSILEPMRHPVRVLTGAGLLFAAFAWRIWGPRGGYVSRLGPLPELMQGDIVTLPLAATGLALLAWQPELRLHQRLVAIVGIVSAVAWVTSDRPWKNDPVLPWIQAGTHGIHVLDLVAIVPLAAAAWVLVPRRARDTKPQSRTR
jgi:hypothetical protein